MKRKYYAWANNEQGASIDVVLPMSDPRRSMRAYEDAARNQLGGGWTVHIMRVDIDGDGQSVLGQPIEVKTFTVSDKSVAAVALGSMTSDKKAAAARENGKRGGRPRKTVE